MPRSAPRPALLEPGGALHPGVSWPRFALAGVFGLVLLGGSVALAIFVPALRTECGCVTALAAAVMVWQQRWALVARLAGIVLLVGSAVLAIFAPDFGDVPAIVGAVAIVLLVWSWRWPSMQPAHAARAGEG